MEKPSQLTLQLSQSRRCIVYIPWLSLISWIIVITGAIAWSAGAVSALNNTSQLLAVLKVDIAPYMVVAKNLAVFAVVACCLLATTMLALSCGRSCTERAVDRMGRATRGSKYWMGVSATITVLWWLVLVLLMFAFFISCIWFGATYSASGILRLALKAGQSAIDSAQRVQNVTKQAVEQMAERVATRIAEASAGAADASAEPDWPTWPNFPPEPPLADSGNATICPPKCLNLELLAYFLKRDICICVETTIGAAVRYSEAAHTALASVVAGSFLLWAGASFLLMTAAAEFAKAKRERALLLRAERANNAWAQGGGGAGAGSASAQPLQGHAVDGVAVGAGGITAYGGGYTEADNMPLLKEEPYVQPYQDQEQPAIMIVRDGRAGDAGRPALYG